MTQEGIDYTLPAFTDVSGESRILSIWDQTINPCEAAQENAANSVNSEDGRNGENNCENLRYGRIPDGFMYGVEYTREEINEALASQNPWDIVPSRDYNGHGTFLAGVACVNRIEERDFAGIAPLSSICMVKCKEAKQSLKDYFQIDTDEPVYAENDIMLGIQYLRSKARENKMPLIICIGMGTSLGSHSNGGILGSVLTQIGNYNGVAVVTSCGNEANTGRHYRSNILMQGEEDEVELRVGSRQGFTMQLWSDAPQLFSIGLISPSGEYSGRTIARQGEKRRINFILDGTIVNVEYSILSRESGDECITLRFQNPSEGIWKIRVFNETNGNAFFNIWLPIRNFLSDTTYFLRSDPDITLVEPSNNTSLISVSYYDSTNRSVAVDSSRGYTRTGNIKPDFAAPGINIYGPLPRRGNVVPILEEERIMTAAYGYMNGSSAAAAITAGTAALLMEWGILLGNDMNMSTISIQKYFIRGAEPGGIAETNRLWGNGTLNLYGVFERLRGN